VEGRIGRGSCTGRRSSRCRNPWAISSSGNSPPGDVQQTLDALAERLSTRSLQILRNCLERAIRHAEIRDLVGRNVAAVVKSRRE
jgi:hypothetical protein